MKTVRREFFKFAGGAAAGVLFTPVPWKLLDDSSIWTQNWKWIPKPPAGEISYRYTSCSLCPAGCGLRVRCAGKQLVGVAAAAGSALCPIGPALHQMPHHPDRIRTVLHGGQPATVDGAVQAISARMAEMQRAKPAERLAIFDSWPGRCSSVLYRKFVNRIPGALYVGPAATERETAAAVEQMTGAPSGSIGFDLGRARTVVSFGTPLLDGWGQPPGIAIRRDQVDLIQVETRQSRTALLANTWVPLKPGTEAAVALGIANVMLADGAQPPKGCTDWNEFRRLVEQFPPVKAASLAGVSPERLTDMARRFRKGAPALAIGGGDPAAGPLGFDVQRAIAGLNLLLGSDAALTMRRPLPLETADLGEVTDLATVPDGSIGVLLIDGASPEGAVPLSLLQRKLARTAVVVALAAYPAAHHRLANFVVPAPAPFEAVEDLPASTESRAAGFSLTTALLPAASHSMVPADFVHRVAQACGVAGVESVAEMRAARVAGIHKTGRGSVLRFADGAALPISAMSAEEFPKALAEGARWMDVEPEVFAARKATMLGTGSDTAERMVRAASGVAQSAEYPLVAMPFSWAEGTTALPTLAGKLFQESDLRPKSGQALIDPDTGTQHGLVDGCEALVETPRGGCRVRVKFDQAVMPGVVHMTVIPPASSSLDICAGEECTWRSSQARVRRLS